MLMKVINLDIQLTNLLIIKGQLLKNLGCYELF